MSRKEVINELQAKLNMTMYALGKKLNLKSTSHVWRLKNGGLKPSRITAQKIIALGDKAGIKITYDMLFGEE